MTSTGEREPPLTEDALFDAYLEACHGGVAESPEAYCERYPQIGPEVRASLAALWSEAGARGKGGLERFGDCEILEPLDRGGMGLVYLARQRSLDRLVVVKVIRPELRTSDTARARFRREAEAAAGLNHPNLVQVLDVGEQDDVAFLVMEYVEGRSLDAVLKEDPRPNWTACVRWLRAVARALHYAHGEGVIHRDVKPSNIRIDRAGAPKLIDFGVARTEGATHAALTTTFAGSPLYAAPEQLTGGSLDGRADVYGLGATLYECVTGRPPFPGESLEQVLREVLANDPIPPRRLVPSLPRDLESVLLKAIERQPERRYDTANEFAADLDALLDGRPVAARRPGLLRRTLRWSRRHPVTARMLLVVGLFALFGAGFGLRQHRHRKAQARAAVDDARRLLGEYQEHVRATVVLEKKLGHLKQQIPYRYLTDDENLLLNEHEVRVERRWRVRDRLFHDVLHELRRAERLDPDVPGVNTVRAGIYAAKWREAERRQDLFAAAFFRGEAERYDPSLANAEAAVTRVVIDTEPPGAEVFLFRLRELDHEPRNALVPIAGTPVHEPGAVVKFAGRRTAIPVAPVPACRIGITPLRYELDEEICVALLRAPGREDVRVLLRPASCGMSRHAITLPKKDSGPAGFVYIVGFVPFLKAARPFWAMRHEVTAAQYREFLEATGDDERAPRNRPGDLLWTKKDDRWVLPSSWTGDWPVLGISWHDAQAYAAWRTSRDPRFTYSLPNFTEWRLMAGGRLYVFGGHFRPRWVSSCFSRPTASPVPVMSYPIDESVFGIYDLTGSAFEWLDEWYDEGRGLRWLGGGAWGHAVPETFKIEAGLGARPERVSGGFGMRLIARRK